MKFLTLAGKEITLNIVESKSPQRSQEDCKSKFQWRVGQEIKKLFPGFLLLEEFAIPGEHLWVDFFIPHLKIAIEADGEQHYTFSQFHHGDKANFRRSQERDNRKRLWCEKNEITLVRVREKDDVRRKIKEAVFGG